VIANITVLTASVPVRAAMLVEAMVSVAAQTVLPERHLVAVDYDRRGGAATYNQLLAQVDTGWFCCLDDDDLLDRDHLVTLAEHTPDRDVVYSYCRTEGGEFEWYNQPFDKDRLFTSSPVPITALCRTELAKKVGGFPDTWDYDRGLWQEIWKAGGQFHTVERPTWTYRLHGDNLSRGGLRGDRVGPG
jgi:hypothetical protein